MSANDTAKRAAAGAAIRFVESESLWICIVDDTKVVPSLGSRSPVPTEVKTDTLVTVLEAIERMGARLIAREHTHPRGGTLIADVHGLDSQDPSTWNASFNR